MAVTSTLGIALLVSFGSLDDPADGDRSEPVSAWQRYFRTQASDYELTLLPEGTEERRLTRKEDPVLRWTQPVRGGDDGAVYLWLDGDRPAAVVSILAWPATADEHVVQHEWQSLADAPLDAKLEGRTRWHPRRAGIEWRPLPKGPRPAATEGARKIQIGQTVRRFSGLNIDPAGKRWELRPLPQPFHRFDRGEKAGAGEAIAGGLFALVEGTDPQALLLIEAVRGEPENSCRYAVTRLSNYAVEVSIDGEQIWSAPAPQTRDTSADYTIVRIEQRKAPADGGLENGTD